MQTRKSDNAFPVFDRNGLVFAEEGEYSWEGISKREYFAARALQGILSSGRYLRPEIPKLAVHFADELIKALNENP